MLRRFYTVMIVPHEGGGLRKLSVSMNFVLSMAGIFLFCFVSSAFLAHYFLDGMHRVDEADQLRVDSERKDIEIARLRAELQRTVLKTELLSERLEQDRDAHPDKWRGPVASMGGESSVDEQEDAAFVTLDGDWRIGARAAQDRVDFWLRQFDEQDVCAEQLERSSPKGVWPVELDACRITSGFQWRRDPITGRAEFHQGVDLAAPRGTAVRATADGYVAHAGRNGGYGNMVKLDHGGGIVSLYGHLRKIHVRAGEWVSRGDLVGEVGSTGRSTGPHLHYEIAEDGRPVNPLNGYLRSGMRIATVNDKATPGRPATGG